MCSPKMFGVCKVKQSHAEVALSLGRPVPCEQGAADYISGSQRGERQTKNYVDLCLKMRFWDPPKNALDFEGVSQFHGFNINQHKIMKRGVLEGVLKNIIC